MKKSILCITAFLFLFALILTAFPMDRSRNILLLFDLKDYDKQIDNTIDYFFQNELQDHDQLIIMTPTRKLAGYSSQTISESRKKTQKEVKDLVRRHTSISGADYRDIYNEMLNIVQQIQDDAGFEGVKNLIAAYDNYRSELAETRIINQELLLNLTDIFQRSKQVTGGTDNLMFLFFQREYRPVPNKDTLNAMRENQLVAFQATEAFLEERSRVNFDTEKIAVQLNQAGVDFNFTYISHRKQTSTRYQRIDNSGDFYNAMEKIADLTGGKTVTTTQPSAIFKTQ